MSKRDNKFEIQIRRETEKIISKAAGIGGLFLVFAYLLLAVGGIYWMLLSVFSIKVNFGIFALAGLLICFAATAIACIPSLKKSLIGMAVLVIAAAALVAYKFDYFAAGVLQVSETVLDKINEYYKTVWTTGTEISSETGAATFFLSITMFCIALILGYAIIRRFSWITVGIVIVIPLIAVLMVGEVPPLGAFILLIISFLAVLGGKGKRSKPDHIHRSASGWMVVLTLIVLVSGALVFQFVIKGIYDKNEEQLEELKQDINDGVESVVSDIGVSVPFGSGRGADGSLTSSEFSYAGTDELSVTLDYKPETAVYFRGFVGQNYTGNRWEAVDGDEFIQYADQQGMDEETVQKNMARLAYELGKLIQEEYGLQAQNMTLEKIHAPHKYGFLPYMAEIPQDYTLHGDGFVGGVSQDTNTFSYIPMDYMNAGILAAGELNLSDAVLDETNRLYDAYAYLTYLDYPEEQLTRLSEQCSQMEFSSVYDIQNYIINMLRDTTSYDVNTPANTSDLDFVENFLYQQKTGYCIHYATTATLMFRMFGVPARYVTGYIAPANTFFDNGDGTYTAQLKDDVSHAWTEIYTQAGWLPVETTPPYETGEWAGTENMQNDATPETGPEDVQSETTPEPTQEAEAEEPTETPAVTEEASAKETPADPVVLKPVSWKFVIRLVLIVIGALIILSILGIIIRRAVLLHKRYKSFSGPDQNENIRSIYRSLHEVMRFDGLPDDITVTDRRFAEELSGRYRVITLEAAERFTEKVLQANFGPEEFTVQDTIRAKGVYLNVSKEISKKLYMKHKIVFYLIKVFY